MHWRDKDNTKSASDSRGGKTLTILHWLYYSLTPHIREVPSSSPGTGDIHAKVFRAFPHTLKPDTGIQFKVGHVASFHVHSPFHHSQPPSHPAEKASLN